jgi:GcrA cell cycle regulator
MNIPGVSFDWTDDAIAQLKTLWAKGQSASLIATKMGGGLTRSAVIGKVQRLRLPGRHTQATSPLGRHFGEAPPKPQPKPRPPANPAANTIANNLARKAEEAAAREARRIERERVAAENAEPPDQSPFAVAFLDRKSTQCAWPLDKFPSATMLVCGAPQDDGCSYCGRHRRISTQRALSMTREEAALARHHRQEARRHEELNQVRAFGGT